ncbi:hypothetical protein [Streptomyces sp. WMMC897]|uniref:hypothetical protein n=1 Tax=Streptomyces sp. WMMC897 TaxID=3014782 RepID=UPI0022B6D449|nr:hypothetical protein [Streptomyces sp. WMMC897]MCZ7415666.1 hypothetical protein [Streptomyces sp. WMMC897]
MFEIRVICDPADADRITATLSTAFNTGPVRRLPSRHTDQHRLYINADHRAEPAPWPTPENAYATAPSIVREIAWTADQAASKPLGTPLGREFWLRKAALLDRIALVEADTYAPDVAVGAIQTATDAARCLMDMDDVNGNDPRAYVRQQYARWADNK